MKSFLPYAIVFAEITACLLLLVVLVLVRWGQAAYTEMGL